MLKKVESEGKAAELVQLFLEVRDELEKLNQKYEKEKERLDKHWERLATEAMAFLKQTGQVNAKTDFGTFYIYPDTRATVVDFERFIDFVLRDPEENIFLMEHRANKTMCRDWIDEHKKPVPGVELKTKRKIGVRRPS